MKRLTAKQERFVQEYLQDFNATQAAIRAGYSARAGKSIACELMGKEHILAAIEEGRRRIADRAEVTVEQIVREAAAVAFSDVRQLYDANGNLLPVHQWPDAAAASVAGVEVEELFEGRGEAREHVGRVRKVKRWEKVKALELLAKYRKLFDDAPKVNISAGAIVFLPRNGRESG